MSVYFITCRARGICKIGYAQNAKARRSSLQTASPSPLVLEATLPGSGELERELHARFADHRLSGEWFTLTDELDQLIRDTGLAVVTPEPVEPPSKRQSDEELVAMSIAQERKLLAEAMRLFERCSSSTPAPSNQVGRFYTPVAVRGGNFAEHYAIRGQNGHRHVTMCADMRLSWDQADRLCDVLEKVREYALQENAET